jgi:hypothetical protein
MRTGHIATSANIYWLLVGPPEVASSRIHGYRVHEHLRSLGFNSELLVAPLHRIEDSPLRAEDLDRYAFLREGEVVIVQKLEGPHTVALLRELDRRGVSSIYLDSDLPLKVTEANSSDRLVCSSEYLASQYREQGVVNGRFLPEAYEADRPPKKARDGDRLTCVWFGDVNPLRWYEVEQLRTVLNRRSLRNWRLVTISNHPFADRIWKLPDTWDDIHEADAVVITGNDFPWTLVKSANRAIQAMALGVPVAAYELPSYTPIIRNGENGFLCKTPKEWERALVSLSDPDVRAAVAAEGYAFSVPNFSIERVGQLWCELLSEVCTTKPPSKTAPTIDQDNALKAVKAKIYERLGSTLTRFVELHQRYCGLTSTAENGLEVDQCPV